MLELFAEEALFWGGKKIKKKKKAKQCLAEDKGEKSSENRTMVDVHIKEMHTAGKIVQYLSGAG